MNGACGFPAHRSPSRTLERKCSIVSSHARPSGQCFPTEAYPLTCPRLNQRFRNDASLHFPRGYGLRVTSLLCRALTVLGTPSTSGTLIGRCPSSGNQELSTGYPHGLQCACLTLHVMNRMPRCRGRQGCLTHAGLSVDPWFPIWVPHYPFRGRVLGSAEVAASPVHPAASAFSITLSTGISRIGTSRHSLPPSSRASRSRPRCILHDIDHYVVPACPADRLDVRHPMWAPACIACTCRIFNAL